MEKSIKMNGYRSGATKERDTMHSKVEFTPIKRMGGKVVTWTIMTPSCERMWEASISKGRTPQSQDRSSRP